ncbi:peptidoglycan DD-metalloendopeptidase family protein [Deferribacteraceae bacterium V6Fe1]|nr:peptidoglycan DD-metalloendopeptidase family protein [Deferribacteraceae bacterium V6Fe1]
MKKIYFILIVILAAFNLFASTYTVKNGDTLVNILSNNFDYSEILAIDKRLKELSSEFTLQSGQTLVYDKDVVRLKYAIDKEFVIYKNNDNLEVKLEQFPIFKLKTVVENNIDSSLFEAVRATGEDDILAIMLANIYEWEIDFFKDIRQGDKFKILVEKKFCRGKFIGYGKILAADFINQGRLIRALYYEDEKTAGYFSPDGKSLRKGFLKAPIKFGRISSGFTSRRLHPVLNEVRAHYGVDYAAPYGTPVHATADGKIIARGYKKGNGYYVKLKHNNGYETMYMHFSKFKQGQHIGSYVKQGEVIGYIGTSGYATGPHVDYRIIKNGTYLNPLAFKSPSKSLPKEKIENFTKATALYAYMLDSTYYRLAKFKMLK